VSNGVVLREAHHDLGEALRLQGQLDEAIAEFREAIRCKKGDKGVAEAHNGIGIALFAKGHLDEAIAEYREAIWLKKDYPEAHNNLGLALAASGQADEAEAQFRHAIRLNKDYAEAHCHLANVLKDKGQFAEALTYLRRGHELGSKDPRRRYITAQWVKHCERLGELDAKLPRVLKGEAQPADIAERLALAQLCQLPCKLLHVASVRFYTDAFAEQPALTDDLQGQLRYNAACAAALAGCGQSEDADQSDDKERGRLRGQALEWLRADLAAYRRLLDRETDKAAPLVRERMQHWQQDKDFAGVRGPDALARLPAAERVSWQQLWKDVADTLAWAQKQPVPEKKSGAK
jgi:serine/threonine-protein kinase